MGTMSCARTPACSITSSKADLVVGLSACASRPGTASGRISFATYLEPGRDDQVDWTAGRVLLERSLDATLRSSRRGQHPLERGRSPRPGRRLRVRPALRGPDRAGQPGRTGRGPACPSRSWASPACARAAPSPRPTVCWAWTRLRPLQGLGGLGRGVASERQQGSGLFSGDGGLSWSACRRRTAWTPPWPTGWRWMPISPRSAACLCACVPMWRSREAGFSANGMRTPAGRQETGASAELGRAGAALGRLSVRDIQELGVSRVDEASLGGQAPLARAGGLGRAQAPRHQLRGL